RLGSEAGLADHIAQRRCAPEAPQACSGESHKRILAAAKSHSRAGQAETALTLAGSGRVRKASCTCKMMSATSTENAKQDHTMVSVAAGPSFSQPVTP